jgi:hypothetical protein
MMNIVPPSPTNPIVGLKGLMTQVFYSWCQLINEEQIIIGTGTPEGVVEAKQGRRYMDDAGTAGAILYIKRDVDDGAGDRTKGWILT